jgi:hypothetical protein
MITSTQFRTGKLIALLMFLTLALVTSCRKDDFDEPPMNGADPNLSVNMNIDSLKSYYVGNILRIDSNWIIAGVVTADDKSGNFYKTIVLEDNTAGISIRLDLSNYNVDYPIGRRVFVKLKGLYMGDYGDLIQLGGWVDSSGTTPSVEPIPMSLVSDYLIGGEYNLNPQPSSVNISDVASNIQKWQNRFIELDSAEFNIADTGKTFADAIALSYGEYDIKQCVGSSSILLRTSGYCDFATKTLPGGNGKIKGICTVYNGTLQLIIRDENDVDMPNSRCNAVIGQPTRVDISALRNLFQGSTLSITNNYYITGVVISDRNGANLNSKNVFVQDATAGVCVRFAANHTFNVGDSVKIDVAGQSFGEYLGLLQVGTSSPSVPLANSTVLATGKNINPLVVTVADILANMAANDTWEASLFKINNATLSGSTTFAGSVQITDATGVMTLYTSSAAAFAATALPGGTVSVTGILSDYTGTVTAPNTNAQLLLRNAADVQ